MSHAAVTPLEDSLALRRDVIATCFLMRDRLGYFVGTWGNISVRVTEGLLVTPSRMPYEQVQPEDLVVVDWDRGVVRGHRVPTSETELHRQLLLERPDLGAIIHSHSPWASVCACAQRSIPVLSDDMAEVIGGEVHCAPYVPAGRHRELAQAVRAAIGPDACAVLLGNHGVAAGGRSLAEALVACQFVEKAAMILVQAQSLGGAQPIPELLWREERHRYLYKYGRSEDVADIIRAEDSRTMYDVVTIGEGMLRLSPPRHGRLRRARTLDLHVCGSQGNVACNLARLGLRTAFVTQVPDHALGLLLRDFYLSCGVDVTHVRAIPDARLGVNFIEFGATPRASAAVYDRANSAASRMRPEDFAWDELLAGTRLAYTDGILPGLSASCQEVTRQFIAAAKRANCLVGFDTNYRAHLWSPAQAAAALAGVLDQVDILVTTPGDAEALFECHGSGEEIARQLHARFGCRIVGVTLGEIHSVLRGTIDSIVLHDGTVYRGQPFDVDAVDRFGAGDAWGAGLIYGYLTRGDLQYAVEFANAMCAADFTIPGDVAHVTPAEIESLMHSRSYRVTR